MIRVCFVCLGNICRSPTSEGVMLNLVKEAGLAEAIQIDSAGTAAYHSGEPADARSCEEALRRGVNLPSRARQFKAEDFARFDYVLAMDAENLDNLQALAADASEREKCSLLRNFDPSSKPNQNVPDPYYGDEHGFQRVYDICEAGCRGLLAHIRDTHSLGEKN